MGGLAKRKPTDIKKLPLRKRKLFENEGAQKELASLDLRRRGLNYEEIGTEMGISPKRAQTMVMGAISRLDEETQEATHAVRKIEIDRLDAMWSAIYAQILVGDLNALDRGLRIMERRSRLLGLDMPTRISADVRKQEFRQTVITLRNEMAEETIDSVAVRYRAALESSGGG